MLEVVLMRQSTSSAARVGKPLYIRRPTGMNKHRQADLPAATVAREWPAVRVAGGWWDGGGETKAENDGEDSEDGEGAIAKQIR
jgi:hypothetical protein